MSRFSCEQKTPAKQQLVRDNQSNVDSLQQNGLLHQASASGSWRLGQSPRLASVPRRPCERCSPGLGNHAFASRRFYTVRRKSIDMFFTRSST